MTADEANAALARIWAEPLGLELATGDWRALVSVLPQAVLPLQLPGDDVTALWKCNGRPIAWTSQATGVGDDLRERLVAAGKTFGLQHDVLALPELASTDRPKVIVWERVTEPSSVIARVQAPRVPLPLTEEEAKLAGKRGQIAPD